MAEKANNYHPQQWITKKRYSAFTLAAKDLIKDDDTYESLLKIFKDTFNYDPTKSSVSAKTKEKIKEKREALKSQGISTYISAYVKNSYEKKKASE